MIKATEIDTYSLHVSGNANGRVNRNAVRETVVRYRDYLREQDYIDQVLQRHDSARPARTSRCPRACE